MLLLIGTITQLGHFGSSCGVLMKWLFSTGSWAECRFIVWNEGKYEFIYFINVSGYMKGRRRARFGHFMKGCFWQYNKIRQEDTTLYMNGWNGVHSEHWTLVLLSTDCMKTGPYVRGEDPTFDSLGPWIQPYIFRPNTLIQQHNRTKHKAAIFYMMCIHKYIAAMCEILFINYIVQW